MIGIFTFLLHCCTASKYCWKILVYDILYWKSFIYKYLGGQEQKQFTCINKQICKLLLLNYYSQWYLKLSKYWEQNGSVRIIIATSGPVSLKPRYELRYIISARTKFRHTHTHIPKYGRWRRCVHLKWYICIRPMILSHSFPARTTYKSFSFTKNILESN